MTRFPVAVPGQRNAIERVFTRIITFTNSFVPQSAGLPPRATSRVSDSFIPGTQLDPIGIVSEHQMAIG